MTQVLNSHKDKSSWFSLEFLSWEWVAFNTCPKCQFSINTRVPTHQLVSPLRSCSPLYSSFSPSFVSSFPHLPCFRHQWWGREWLKSPLRSVSVTSLVFLGLSCSSLTLVSSSHFPSSYYCVVECVCCSAHVWSSDHRSFIVLEISCFLLSSFSEALCLKVLSVLLCVCLFCCS